MDVLRSVSKHVARTAVVADGLSYGSAHVGDVPDAEELAYHHDIDKATIMRVHRVHSDSPRLARRYKDILGRAYQTAETLQAFLRTTSNGSKGKRDCPCTMQRVSPRQAPERRCLICMHTCRELHRASFRYHGSSRPSLCGSNLGVVAFWRHCGPLVPYASSRVGVKAPANMRGLLSWLIIMSRKPSTHFCCICLALSAMIRKHHLPMQRATVCPGGCQSVSSADHR